MFWRGNQRIAGNNRPRAGRAATWFKIAAAAVLLTLMAHGRSFADVRELKLYNLHTHERATIIFKRNGVYDRAGLQALDEFLRDWRQDRPTNMDPHLFDLLWQVYKDSGSKGYIQVVCGYRSPPTNAMLRRRSNGVAKNSLHMQGKAMDFYLPDVPLAKLRAIGLKMQLGGVGFYPTSGSPFVHMDTGSVRHWPRMTRQQLVNIFPNGDTLHVPSDGKPLPGYDQALAAYKARIAAETPRTEVASFAGSPVLQDVLHGQPALLASRDTATSAADAEMAEPPMRRSPPTLRFRSPRRRPCRNRPSAPWALRLPPTRPRRSRCRASRQNGRSRSPSPRWPPRRRLTRARSRQSMSPRSLPRQR